MSVILPPAPGLDLSLTTATGTERQKLAATAKQFEAVFVRQMLAAARKTDFGGDDALCGGEAMDTFRQLQDEHFADLTAQTGTLGLATLIEAQMARFLKPETALGASASTPRADTYFPRTAHAEPVRAPAKARGKSAV